MNSLFGACFLNVERIGYFLYFYDIFIKIFGNVDKNIKEWHSDHEPNKSHEMFGNQKNQKGDKYRKFHVRRDNFGIEVVSFHRMNQYYHDSNHNKYIKASQIESDQGYRYRGNQKTKYRNKPQDKYKNGNGGYKRESFTIIKIPDHEQSESGQYRIYQGNNCLSFEYQTKSFGNFLSKIGKLLINKSEVS